MAEHVTTRKQRKYNLSNVSKIQDIPPSGNFITEIVLFNHEKVENVLPEREYYNGVSKSGHRLAVDTQPSLNQQPEVVTGRFCQHQASIEAVDTPLVSSTSEPERPVQTLQLAPIFAERSSPQKEERFAEREEPDKVNKPLNTNILRIAPQIQKARVDLVNVVPSITITHADNPSEIIKPSVNTLQSLQKEYDQTCAANQNLLNPTQNMPSIGEGLPSEEALLNSGMKLTNAFSFQDSPPFKQAIEVSGPEKRPLIPHLVQQATFGVSVSGASQLDEIVQSLKSVSSPRRNLDDLERSPRDRDLEISPLNRGMLPSLDRLESHDNSQARGDVAIKTEEVPNTLNVPLMASPFSGLNQNVGMPSPSSPISPEGKVLPEDEPKEGQDMANHQLSFGASPNIGVDGPFSKMVSQPIIEMKQKPAELPLKGDEEIQPREGDQSPANTSKSVPIHHKPALYTHVSLPGRSPTSPEEKSPSMAPSERELSLKQSKSVKGETRDNNLEKMRRMIDHSLKSGGGTKRSGSFIDIDDAKSTKSFMNEDKMKRRIKEQFPTNDVFLENNSGKSGELNDLQANYIQKKQNNQIIDTKLLKSKIVRGEGHNLHHPHMVHHSQALGENVGHELHHLSHHHQHHHEKPLFSNVYPRLALVMISLLFAEILRKLVAN